MLLVLLATFGLLWILFARRRDRIGFGRLSLRGAMVLAFIGFEVLLLIITEVASFGHSFTAGSLEISWIVTLAVLLVAVRKPIAEFVAQPGWGTEIWRRVRRHLASLDAEERIWIAVLAVLFGTLIVDGLLYPPSNTDSLVYHLARVEHWIQNRTIAPYAAHYLGQIELSPLAEYNLAHLHLMSGTDRFDAGVSLLSAFVCIIGVSELARLLGASRGAQVVACVVCGTIPSGVLLATNTENDYLAASTGLALLVVLAAFEFEGAWATRSIIVGVIGGLAYMAKGSTPTLIGPAALALLILAIHRQSHTTRRVATAALTLKRLSVVTVGAAVVAVPFLIQNLQLFGSVIGPVSKSTLSSPNSLTGAVANIVRSTASNFDIGDGQPGISTYVSRVMLGGLHPVFSQMHVHPYDPGLTLSTDFNPFLVRDYTSFQGLDAYGANPWHVLLMMASLCVLIVGVWCGKRYLKQVLVVAIGLAIGYVVFTGLARWSPYGVRYLLPLLVAWSAAIAIAISEFPRWVGRFVMIGLVVACLPQLLNNGTRPLVSPAPVSRSYLEPYFVDMGGTGTPADQASAYQTITTMLAQSTCTSAALGNRVLLEYPLWVGLKHEHWNGLLNDVNVSNVSRRLESSHHTCARITQQGSNYRGPDNGTVNVRQNDLALSIRADKAATIRTPILGFGSDVAGTRILPGGGWYLPGLGRYPILGRSGSVYVFSSTARRVHLVFGLPRGVQQSTLAQTQGNGLVTPAQVTKSAMSLEVSLKSGINQIRLVTVPGSATIHRELLFTGVTVMLPNS